MITFGPRAAIAVGPESINATAAAHANANNCSANPPPHD